MKLIATGIIREHAAIVDHYGVGQYEFSVLVSDFYSPRGYGRMK